jgi:geranylgeranyl pyrophosphate synthase
MNQNELANDATAALEKRWEIIELHLLRLRQQRYAEAEPLAETINYILAGEGKRVRGMLALLCAEIFSGDHRHGLTSALALEMVHAYSLAHDDLPCLDNDDMRRGRMSAHKMFDVPRAMLAGDALLTDAFWIISCDEPVSKENCWWHGIYGGNNARLGLVRELSLAAGGRGMVYGQMLDVYWTGKSESIPREALDRMHLEKTGALLGAACAMGALAGGAQFQEADDMRQFGRQIGLAFQVVDDILDTGTETGKSVGKDAAQGKSTYVTVMSIDEAVARAADLTKNAMTFLDRFHDRGDLLRYFVKKLLDRRK